jgi:ketosteroid isomerase-like protein
MKKLLLCFLVSASLIACTNQETKVDIAAEEAAVRARTQALAAAEASKNTDASLAFFAEDAINQTPGNPQIQDLASMRKAYDGTWATIKSFKGTTSKITVSKSGDLAWEYGINRVVIGTPKGDLLDMGKYIVVWKKIKGEWYVSAVALSSDAPAPSPLPAADEPN